MPEEPVTVSFLAADVTAPYVSTVLLTCPLPHAQSPLPQSRDQVREKKLEKKKVRTQMLFIVSRDD